MFNQKGYLILSSKIWANFVGWVEERNPTSNMCDRDRAQPNLRHNRKSKIALLVLNLSAILFLPALTIAAPQPSTPPTNCPPLEPGTNPPPAPRLPSGSVLTANTISQTGLTRPSLWWTDEQFGNKLLNNWCAYPDERRIDLIVNRQIWSLLTYLERYAFVNHFGTVARDFQYNVRVFNQQNVQLATYTCNFSATPVSCNLQLDTTNIRSVGSR